MRLPHWSIPLVLLTTLASGLPIVAEADGSIRVTNKTKAEYTLKLDFPDAPSMERCMVENKAAGFSQALSRKGLKQLTLQPGDELWIRSAHRTFSQGENFLLVDGQGKAESLTLRNNYRGEDEGVFSHWMQSPREIQQGTQWTFGTTRITVGEDWGVTLETTAIDESKQ